MASPATTRHSPSPSLDDTLRSFRIVESFRSGDVSQIATVLTPPNSSQPDLSYKSPQFVSLLHLAVNISPRNVVEWLIQKNVDVNVVDERGETALHLAARNGRADLVEMLLKCSVIVTTIRNSEGKSAIDVAKNEDIRKKIQLHQASFAAQKTATMHKYASEPTESENLYKFFSDPRVAALVDINHQDSSTGETVLHQAAKRGDADLVRWCIKERGADPFIRDRKGKFFYEVTKDDKIKAVFKEVTPNMTLATTTPDKPPRLTGILHKWTNYASGYKGRWFVLENGILSYYRHQDDVPNSCRGAVNLKIAKIKVDTTDRHRFDVIGKNSIRYHLRAEHVTEAQRWILALTQSKVWLEDREKKEKGSKTGKLSVPGDDQSAKGSETKGKTALTEDAASDIGDDGQSHGHKRTESVVSEMPDEDIELLKVPHVETLQVSINTTRTQIDIQGNLINSSKALFDTIVADRPDLKPKVDEALNVFKVSVDTVKAAFNDAMKMCEERELYWKRKYEYERERKNMWEENLRRLAEDYESMEREARSLAQGKRSFETSRSIPASTSITPLTMTMSPSTSTTLEPDYEEDDDDEFYDAVEGAVSATDSNLSSEQSQSVILPSLLGYEHPDYSFHKSLRSSLPVDHALLRNEVSLWNVLKNAIGKDLSKITLPVYFNEPIGMLQRLCEDIEYSQLLDLAWSREKSDERLLLVAAFAMSNYASTVDRTGKPFNPLLGETYEYVRKDRGFRYISEQVSHHPPISACHCESDRYDFYSEVNVKSKFWGKSLEVLPQGVSHVILKLSHFGIPTEHYSWKKVTTAVNNLIVGKLWIDHYGDMVVTNHRTKEKCILTFKATGWRNKDRCEISGKLIDANGKQKWEVFGRWDEKLVCRPYSDTGDPPKNSFSLAGSEKLLAGSLVNHSSQPDLLGDKANATTNTCTTLWRRYPVPVLSISNFNLTPFAMTLNQMTPYLKEVLCPTDCRLRPDQRAMEEGEYDLASKEKVRVEEKQRAKRKERESQGSHWRPRWFTRELDPDTNEEYWKFNGEYWEHRQKKEWSDIEDIF
ncbi:Oxysterol-binding protein-domain-containing protein [Paraphysoderma sedebokerense]|nr:Oxysterol-binding protein-domain-containing protein [Paraphysoderma sedebokerense]